MLSPIASKLSFLALTMAFSPEPHFLCVCCVYLCYPTKVPETGCATSPHPASLESTGKRQRHTHCSFSTCLHGTIAGCYYLMPGKVCLCQYSHLLTSHLPYTLVAQLHLVPARYPQLLTFWATLYKISHGWSNSLHQKHRELFCPPLCLSACLQGPRSPTYSFRPAVGIWLY